MFKTSIHIAFLLFLFCLPLKAVANGPVEIQVEGIEGEARKNVEAALALPSGFIREGSVNRQWLEYYTLKADEKVKDALEPFGYYNAVVTATLEQSGDNSYLLKVRIVAGKPVRLEQVLTELKGDGAAEPVLKEKAAAFRIHIGSDLNHEVYEKAKSELLAAARELGYLDVNLARHLVTVNPAESSATIDLVLDTGHRYRFGDVAFEGATAYPDVLLRRFITFKPGQPFSYRALAQTQLQFSGSPYFTNASAIPDKESADDFRLPVVIRVKPAPRLTIRPGLGYGTDTGFRGSINYRDLSLFYPGNIFNADVTISERLQGIGLAYSIPGTRNLDTATSLQINLQREELNNTLSSLVATELNHTIGFRDNLLATGYIRFMYERYHAGLDDTFAMLPLPGVRIAQRRYDDPIRPAAGYHYGLEICGTTHELGADVGFLQGTAEGGGMLALPWRLSLLGKVKGGATIIDDHLRSLPVSLRFFAGGDTSVRGYAYKSLGPKDITGTVVGGKYLLQGSLELQRALFEDWGVSLFYDMGNAFDSFHNLHIYQGAGVGAQYFSPVGVINLNLARQLGIGNPGYRVHFSIGFQL